MAEMKPIRISLRCMLPTAQSDMDVDGDVYAPELVEALVEKYGEYIYAEFDTGEPVVMKDGDKLRVSYTLRTHLSYVPPEKDAEENSQPEK